MRTKSKLFIQERLSFYRELATLSRKNVFSILATCFLAIASASQAAASDEPSAEPQLFRTLLRIEPSRAQVGTLPARPRDWRLPPPISARISEILTGAKFPEPFVRSVQEHLRIDPESQDGVLAASEELLALLSVQQRRNWWDLLARYSLNRSYRWPIAVDAATLAKLDQENEYAEAVATIRRWGIAEGGLTLFADTFALSGKFRNLDTERAFFQTLLGVRTVFLKQISDQSAREEIEAVAAYWRSGTRNREIEPFLAAVARLEDYDRVDLAHMLPRLPRALLYTYPPSFADAEEPSKENAALASAFFSASADGEGMPEEGFAFWLKQNCDIVSGPREYGDIIVFEDPNTTRWPYCLVYIADDIAFGRRPSLFGPWEFHPLDQVPQLNPKLKAAKPVAYRPRSTAEASPPPATASRRVERPISEELAELPDGPWGELRSYQLYLTPTASRVAALPTPSDKPVWRFRNVSKNKLQALIESPQIPTDTRNELLGLLSRAKPDANRIITLYPSENAVLSIPPDARSRLYEKLHYGARADDATQDIYFPSDKSPAEWADAEGLSPDAKTRFLQLAYQKGRLIRLADYGLLYHGIHDPDDRIAALRSIMRTRAIVVLLKRPAPSDVDSLAAYWRDTQKKSVRALLQSFAASRDMEYLDITHLLPPLARELSNIYIQTPLGEPTPSCYWSSLNFEADRPDSRFLVTTDNPAQVEPRIWDKLKRDYYRVPSEERLGDLIVYRDRANDFTSHICAYVAGGVVFTKNGYGPNSPWCLMRSEEVDVFYLTEGIERLVFRLNVE